MNIVKLIKSVFIFIILLTNYTKADNLSPNSSTISNYQILLNYMPEIKNFPVISSLVLKDELLIKTFKSHKQLRIVFLIIEKENRKKPIFFYENIPYFLNLKDLREWINNISGFSLTSDLQQIENILKKNKFDVVPCLTDNFYADNYTHDVSHGRTCFKPIKIKINKNIHTLFLTAVGSGSFNNKGNGKLEFLQLKGQEKTLSSYNHFFPISIGTRIIDIPRLNPLSNILLKKEKTPILFNLDISFYRINNLPGIIFKDDINDFFNKINNSLEIMKELKMIAKYELINNYKDYLILWTKECASFLGKMHNQNHKMSTLHLQDFSVIPGIICDRKEIKNQEEGILGISSLLKHNIYETLVAFQALDALIEQGQIKGILNEIIIKELIELFYQFYFKELTDINKLIIYASGILLNNKGEITGTLRYDMPVNRINNYDWKKFNEAGKKLPRIILKTLTAEYLSQRISLEASKALAKKVNNDLLLKTSA